MSERDGYEPGVLLPRRGRRPRGSRAGHRGPTRLGSAAFTVSRCLIASQGA